MPVDVYTDYRDIPHDEPPVFEHDDHLGLRHLDRQQPRRELFSVSTPIEQKIVVPFRPCSKGDTGDTVYAAKRANARFRGKGRLTVLQTSPLRQRRTFGSFFQRELSETQERLRVPRTGSFDEQTWRVLAPYFDSFSVTLLQPPALPNDLRLLLGWLSVFYNGRYFKHYSQRRPSELGPAERVDWADCSGMVAGAMDWAGALKKVDWRWTNTDVQILFGKPIEFRHVQVGDVVLYGHGRDPNHEAIVVSLNPVTVQSFGSYPAKLLPVDYDRQGRGQRIAIRRFL